ncbi:MAG: hypothetical protein ABIE42_09055 [Candidatus Eisenbacteria bacterium]
MGNQSFISIFGRSRVRTRTGWWPRRMRGQTGSSLVAVLAITTAVLLVGGALFALGVGESGVVDYSIDSTRAFWIAESGVERARGWLEAQASEVPPVFPADGAFPGQPLGGGEYDVTITQYSGANPWVTEYQVISTGVFEGAVSHVRAVLRNETFAQYMYFADEMREIWFITGDRLDGRVHTNGYIRISGDPWFGMKVSTAKDEIIMRDGSDPTFEGGYEVGVEEVPLPVPSDLVTTVRAQALSEGIYEGALTGEYAKYEVKIGKDGWLGSFSYRAYRRPSPYAPYSWSDWTDVYIPDINGVVWFEEPVHVSGVLDGQLTIGSAVDIYIDDNIIYNDSTPEHGPDLGGDDVLGLVSAGNVVVARTTANQNDVVIHAHMLALDTSFTAEDYDEGLPRGTLTLYGGFAQQTQGAVGMFGSSGIIHGYQKDYHYDMNLLGHSPPGYPGTGKYLLTLWEELSSIEA